MKKHVSELNSGEIIVVEMDIVKVSSVEIFKRWVDINGQIFNDKSNRYGRVRSIAVDSDYVEAFATKEEAVDYLIATIEYYNQQFPFFVYGTLRPGHGNYENFFRGNTIKEASGTVKGVMYAQGIPYLYEGDEVVHGDVLWVPEDRYDIIRNHVDMLEGFRLFDSRWSHYVRKEVTATLSNGETVQAWAYYCADGQPHNRLTKVPNNDYNNHRAPSFRR